MASSEQQLIVTSTGGLKIFTRNYAPERPLRGCVVLVHGFNSHSGYLAECAKLLAARGFGTCALDLRGRGKSEGPRLYVESFADYEADVHAAVGSVQARFPGAPLFLLGHSAGGVIACEYALAHQAALAGLICESFAFQVPAPDIALALLKGVGYVAPHAQVLRLKPEDFSRDPAVVSAMHADRLIRNEAQPARTVAEMVRADARLKNAFPKLTLPLLILHGTDDRAAQPSGSQLFYDNCGARDKTLKLYEGHAHDLLNDVGKELVLQDIVEWLEARAKASTE